MHHESGPFTIPDIRNFVPEKLKPWILFCFFIIYQFSGGVYLAAVCEMSSSLALMQQDIMMAGYASLVGLALTFTIMFRLKFRFPPKTSLITTAIGLIFCNLICVYTHNVPLLVATCFIAGIFRMWGTFACNSTIQLWITPKREMPVWFCYIQLCIQGFLQLSGLTTTYVAFLTKWEYMHWFIIGLLLCILLVTYTCFKHYRSMPKLPLFGIDWLGGLLWGITIICTIFVLNYGDYYDWYQSVHIWTGTIFGLLALGLNVWRASFIRHPFIANETWRYRSVWVTFIVLMVVDILISPSHYFEHMYTGAILGYDALNIVSLNWMILLGTLCGTIFTFRTFVVHKWKYKTMTLIGFSLLIGYLLVMYFIIDYNLPKEILYLPLLLRGAGYIIISISFITALSTIPFTHFPQALTIQAFMSACCGALIGEAFLEHIYKFTMHKNVMLLSANIDNVNPVVNHVPFESLFGMLQQQAMIVSMKEIYGWLCIFGLFCLLLFFLRESSLRPTTFHPKFSTIRRTIKQQLRFEKVVEEEI